jgi:DNA-binding transcriptional LysR family regulator
MDRIDAMRAFVAVAEEGGFAAAARRLALSGPAVTRAVAALETRVGARLFVRTTRVVRLTDAGGRFLVDAKRILAELDEAEATAAGAQAEPRGLLAVTAPSMFGRRHVSPHVLAFIEHYPAVTVRALFVDRIVDLVDEGFDVAVRIAHLPDSSLTAVRVGAVRSVVCASPAYLAAHGRPRTPADLADHRAVLFSPSMAVSPWSFSAGPPVPPPPARIIAGAVDLAVTAAVAGHGLTRVLSYQARDEVADGRLEIVLAEHEPPPFPVHVVFPEGRGASARVRAFVDLAVAGLRAEPALR